MWLTRLALKYPVSTFLFSLTLVVLGVVAFQQLQVEMLPDITIPVVTVVAYYNGAGPLDMEQSVTLPLERAVSSVNDVDYIQSTTREGMSRLRINFNWGVNVDVALVDVVQRVNRIANQLPDGVSTPNVFRFDITSRPVCQVLVSGEMDGRDLYDLAINIIAPQLEHQSGVASASVSGGQIREIQVILSRDRMQALGMPVQSVLTSIANSNLLIPSGELKSGIFNYSLKTDSRLATVEPIENIIIRLEGGVPIRIKDVARVIDGSQEQTRFVRIDSKPGLAIQVQKLASANTIEVVDRIRAAIPKLTGIPPGIDLKISFDQSQYIRNTIHGLLQEAILGALLAIVIILVFLRNMKGTTIVMVAIPLAFLFTFIFFRFIGLTLNIMTFGGLALAVGRLVDDSIVELEAISRHYNNKPQEQTRLQATLAAAREVASPIFISTLATVIVFFPIVFLTGITKLLFLPLTATIAIALFGSFFVSRTVTPLMCLRFLPPERTPDPGSGKLSDRIQIWARKKSDGLDAWYHRNLNRALSHRRWVIWMIVGLAALSSGLIPFIGTEFFSDQDEGQFNVNVRMPVGTRAEETDRYVRQVESILQANVPEMQSMMADIGTSTGRSANAFGRNSGGHTAQIQIGLKPVTERQRSVFEIVKDLRPKLAQVVGPTVTVNQSGFMRFLLNFGSSDPIAIEIRGFDLDQGMAVAEEVAAIVRSTPGASDVNISRDDKLPELRVRIDRQKAGVLGLEVGQIASTINTLMNGSVPSLYSDPVTGNQYDILVRLDESFRSHYEDISKIVLTTKTGEQVPLGNVATIERTNSPVQIERKYQQRMIEVTGNATGRPLGDVAAEIRSKLADVVLPPGFELKIGGNVEQQQKAFKDLLLAFGLAILLVYVVMASQFQSLLDPFIIMFTVPLGIIGVFWALFLMDVTLSVTSFQGIIVMVGIVVSNGVLLVDYTNRLRKSGVELEDAVRKAGVVRLKPILMTSLATVFGLLPMALGIGGEQTQAPLAIAVIGGLTLSTFLTLFFIPVLYSMFEEKFKREMKDDDE
jgi:CzcA family heavy metal efflux pump